MVERLQHRIPERTMRFILKAFQRYWHGMATIHIIENNWVFNCLSLWVVPPEPCCHNWKL